MYLTLAAIIALFLSTASNTATAFSPAILLQRTIRQSSKSTLTLLQQSSAKEDEIAKLLAAAAKAREEANRLSEELGKPSVTATTAATPKKSLEEFQALLPALINEADVNKQAEQWSQLKSSKTVQYFGQAVLRTFPVSLQMLEQRTGLTSESLGLEVTNVNLDDFKYATLYVLGFSAVSGVASLVLLPPNLGATACYIFALLPILFLGIGSSAPQVIANVIAGFKGEKGLVNVPDQERIVRHEAAHFCVGYWCGLPVSKYSVLDGVARVEFGVCNNRYSSTEVAALAVTALAGLVGEALQWKKAKGAEADLLALEGVFRQAQDFIGAAQQQDITRWGALTATNLLRANADKYEKVVQAFGRQALIEECITILES